MHFYVYPRGYELVGVLWKSCRSCMRYRLLLLANQIEVSVTSRILYICAVRPTVFSSILILRIYGAIFIVRNVTRRTQCWSSSIASPIDFVQQYRLSRLNPSDTFSYRLKLVSSLERKSDGFKLYISSTRGKRRREREAESEEQKEARLQCKVNGWLRRLSSRERPDWRELVLYRVTLKVVGINSAELRGQAGD